MGVYGIFCMESGECLYVGLSKDIVERWKSHIKHLKYGTHPRKEFSVWFADRGRDEKTLRFEVLELGSEDDLNSLEVKWFLELNPRFYGKVPSENEKWSHSVETKERIRNTHIANSIKNGVMYISKTCLCGKQFMVREKSNRVSCSFDCKILVRPPKKTKDIIFCKQCLVEINSFGVEYCSRECTAESRIIPMMTNDLREMYWDKGMSLQDISMIYGVSRQTVYKRLKKFGIPRRPKNS